MEIDGWPSYDFAYIFPPCINDSEYDTCLVFYVYSILILSYLFICTDAVRLRCLHLFDQLFSPYILLLIKMHMWKSFYCLVFHNFVISYTVYINSRYFYNSKKTIISNVFFLPRPSVSAFHLFSLFMFLISLFITGRIYISLFLGT